ncbi:MAG: alpha/beta hydrolase [Sphingobacteriaceae bacterium]|nr:MAG: alpha/beta hydrolase [Sphingobacteriaceae bacterium]
MVSRVKSLSAAQAEDLNPLLWQLICYAPKMPLRLVQEQLLAGATRFSLNVEDEYFAKKELLFNGFKWGEGKYKVLITHGWGSKAADFTELITALKENKELEIIAFDAPGNGSSEGELSNLLLFVQAIKAIVFTCGAPDIVIGHSLGAMANVIALKEMGLTPSLLISLAPLIRLKENFEATMTSTGVSQADQEQFFKSFEERFEKSAMSFNLNDWYSFDVQLNHYLAFDQNDQISPYSYLKDFLDSHPFIKSQAYIGTGHDRIIKTEQVISDLIRIVAEAQL